MSSENHMRISLHVAPKNSIFRRARQTKPYTTSINSGRLPTLVVLLALLLPIADYFSRATASPLLLLFEPLIFGIIALICAGDLLNARKVSLSPISKLLLALLLLYILLTILDPSGLKNTVLIGSVLLLYTFLNNHMPTYSQLRMLRGVALVFLVAVAILYLTTGADVQKNTVGSYCMVYLLTYYAFEMHDPRKSMMTMLVLVTGTAALLSYIDFRGGILQCLIIAVALLYEKLNLATIRPSHAFIASLATLAAAIFVLAFMDDLYYYHAGIANSLENLSERTFASGRNIIWPLGIEYVLDKPLLGNGAGFLLRSVADFSWSAHNTFLQIALQSGIIGATLLLSIFYAAYRLSHSANQGYRSNQIRGAAIIFCVFTYNVFESSLLQNSMPIGLIHWICIATTCRAVTFQKGRLPKALSGGQIRLRMSSEQEKHFATRYQS